MRTLEQRVEAVYGLATAGGLSDWERYTFLPSVSGFNPSIGGRTCLEPHQERILVGIEGRLRRDLLREEDEIVEDVDEGVVDYE